MNLALQKVHIDGGCEMIPELNSTRTLIETFCFHPSIYEYMNYNT